MTEPRFSFVPVLDHEIHLTEWGNPENEPLVMWHGLARTGRDFDELARALSDEFFVLCPDTIGRGLSSWSRNPEAEYCIEFYSGIAADLLDHYGIDRAGWVGTSMGGLIGMRMASGPMSDRLCYLVINDIGPEIPQEAIDRIVDYAGTSPEFGSVCEAEEWLRAAYAPFGPASDAFWTRMARTSVRRKDNGRFTTHYDPRIIVQFEASPDELTSWDRFAQISLPTHVIQGKSSDLLTGDILQRMKECLPEMAVTVVEDCGHAPTLTRQEDIAHLRQTIHGLRAAS